MKKINIFILTLTLLLCSVSPSVAKQTKANKKNSQDYKIEYLNLKWWEKYNDPTLNEYLIKAYENNYDLKIANLNVKQAQQVVKESFAQQLPHFGIQGNIFRDLQSSDVRLGDVVINDYSQSNFVLPLTMTYELDIWGENYLKTKAIKKQVEMIKENERATYIALTSQLASEYFNLIKLDKLIKNQEELVNLQTEIARMAEIKYNNGLAPITELLAEKKILTSFKEELNAYYDTRLVIGREIGVLTGQREVENKYLKRNDYNNLTLIEVPESISAEVIKYRPDLLKIEDYIEKIGIDVKVARRDFLPKFLIYGQAGFNAYQLTNIFGNHTFKSNIGFMPSLDLFTGGAKMAHFRYKKLEYQKAQQTYEKTILTSIQEVNNSLSSADMAKKNYEQSLKRFKLAEDEYNLSNRKFEIGAKSKMDNMRAKEVLLLAEKSNVSNKINYAIASINVYKAIGGKDFTTINEKL